VILILFRWRFANPLPERRRKRIETPGYFGSWAAVVAFRNRLEAEVHAGRRTAAWYWARVKKVSRAYARERYYSREASE